MAARNVLEPVISAEYGREVTGVVAYAGNVSVVQTVALVFPLSPAEMATWQERFRSALEETGAEAVNTTSKLVA